MSPASRRSRSGFTLIEVLVVVAIVIALIALTLAVGRAVGRSAKASQTRSAMQAIDMVLNDLIQTRGDIPSPVVEDPRDPDILLPIADARNLDGPGAEPQVINSGGLLLLQVRREGLTGESITGLDSDLVQRFSPYAVGDAEDDGAVPELPTPMDAWGNPIRYVHPRFDGLLQGSDPENPGVPGGSGGVSIDDERLLGEAPDNKDYAYAEIRRNGIVGAGDENLLDADGGQATSQRPYLYSAGPDGRVGRTVDGGEVVEDFNADNVYLTMPNFLSPQ